MATPAAEPDRLSPKGESTVHEPTVGERTVARRTAEARATVPDLEMSLEVDMGGALARLAKEACSLDGLLVSACAAALRVVPRANSAYRDGRFETYARINIGFVVATDDGYVIPTVFDADEKSPGELSVEIETLVAGARARSLPAPAFANATFTLWNAGALGVTQSGIVINPPQAAALAAGALRDAPVIQDGEIVAGHLLTLTLACDHRILYGATAAAFLTAAAHALAEA